MKRPSSLVFLTFALTACGASPDATDGGNYDAMDGDWSLTNRFSPQSLTPDGENTLYYERALTATSAWGPIEVDRSNGERGIGDGKTLTLNGVQHAKGYGVHAPSELKYSLAATDNAKCVRFKAQIGLDDEVGDKGSAVFQIWGDSGKLFDSGVMTGVSATRSVNVNLRGQSNFRMVVTDAGNGKSFDHADWINPTITCVPDITATVSKRTGIYQDTHRNVPVTFTNKSKSFKGNLTFQLIAGLESSDFEPRYRLDTPSTAISGAGTVTRDLSVYMGTGPEGQYEENPYNEPLPDALAVYALGEEVARVELGVYPLAQRVSVDFPNEVVELREGESRTVQATVTITPGGESVPVKIRVVNDLAGNAGWWYVSGDGTVPASGGTFPITAEAIRQPTPEESFDPVVQMRLIQQTFAQVGGQYFADDVNLRYVP